MSGDFSPSGYRSLLDAALARGYAIRPMAGALDAPRDRPVLLLRHDVDLSLDYALELARLEAEAGVAATYFILLYNEFYNPFSPSGMALIRRIGDLGHEIGLHWDSSLYPPYRQGVVDGFKRDLERLADIAGHDIQSASQHIPIDSPLYDVGSLVRIEAYSPRLAERYSYVSDSSMQWRDTTPRGLMERRADIQFLAHPVWWTAPGEDRRAKLAALTGRAAAAAAAGIDAFRVYVEECLARRAAMDKDYVARRRSES